MTLEEIEKLHANRHWISWEEEGWLIQRVRRLEDGIRFARNELEASGLFWDHPTITKLTNIIEAK